MTSHAASRLSWAVLFDWDGVLVDSRALHESAWNQVAREFGYPHGPEDFKRHFGTQNHRAITAILRWTEDESLVARISTRKESLFRQQLQGRQNLWLPGVEEFVAALEARRVPCGVVSSSPRENITVLLAGSPLEARFQCLVTAEDARVGKPDPEGFLLGAARLGAAPERCVVFEDAPAGIEAARRAGMRVVALETTHPASELGNADFAVARFSLEVLERVEGWFAGN